MSGLGWLWRYFVDVISVHNQLAWSTGKEKILDNLGGQFTQLKGPEGKTDLPEEELPFVDCSFRLCPRVLARASSCPPYGIQTCPARPHKRVCLFFAMNLFMYGSNWFSFFGRAPTDTDSKSCILKGKQRGFSPQNSLTESWVPRVADLWTSHGTKFLLPRIQLKMWTEGHGHNIWRTLLPPRSISPHMSTMAWSLYSPVWGGFCAKSMT